MHSRSTACFLSTAYTLSVFHTSSTLSIVNRSADSIPARSETSGWLNRVHLLGPVPETRLVLTRMRPPGSPSSRRARSLLGTRNFENMSNSISSCTLPITFTNSGVRELSLYKGRGMFSCTMKIPEYRRTTRLGS